MKEKTTDFSRILSRFLTLGGATGLLAAVVLMIEKVTLLQNPSASLSCDLNPVIACGSVINTAQASAFGFPNPIIGIVGFSVVLTVGVAMLAGAKFPRWFWQGLQAGTIFGLIFVHWLIYQSLYNIGALCPYCMLVWIVTIPIFWFTTLYNVQNGHIQFKWLKTRGPRFHFQVLGFWYLLIIVLILERFWYYWSTLV